MLQYKCNKCDSDMVLEEDVHVCTECENALTEEEAKKLFEEGEIVASVLSEEKKKKDEEEEDPDEPENDDDEDDEDEDKMNEEIEKLFANVEEINEAWIEKAKTVFETLVAHEAKKKAAVLEKEYAEKLEAEVNEQVEGIVENLDKYLDLATTEFLKENELAIESSLRVEMVDNFMEGLKKLFAESYIDIPADKVDVVESLAEKVEKLEAKLDEAYEEKIKLQEQIASYEKKAIVEELSKGLVETQKEKFDALLEDVSADSIETFKEKAQAIRESIFSNPASKTEPEKPQKKEAGNDLIANALKALKSA